MTYRLSSFTPGRRLLSLLLGAAWLLYAARTLAGDSAPREAAFRVNVQTDLNRQSAAVALSATGGLLVAWQSEVEASGDEIRARLFDPRGAALGGEIEVNSLRDGPQNLPAIAMARDGAFVVVWQSLVGSNFQIRARLFDAAGAARGDEFLISTRRGDTHGAPVVAMAGDGSFVVAWESPLHGSYEIRARHFDATGHAAEGEIAVNTQTASSQRSPALAMDTRGNFVVVWRSNIAGSFELRAQRFDARAIAQGGELAVNAFRAGDQLAPAVAMDGRGNFVVVWENALDERFEIRSRRFTAQGVALGEETAVSPEGAGEQFAPAVGMAAQGEFVVAWHSEAGGDSEIRARTFARGGAAQGGELAVNSVSAGTQKSAALAMNERGALVVGWHSVAEQGWEITARSYSSRKRLAQGL